MERLLRAPSTRYQGSKLKLLPWIGSSLSGLSFDTALDAFGGTGSVAYLMKAQGKEVAYNDYLRFNQMIGKALVENSRTRFPESRIPLLFVKKPGRSYATFIADTFSGVYYTDEENVQLDTASQNISCLRDAYQKALAYHALFQACMAKRPYNLFHRKNLYMRTAKVERSFGNKTTWDTPLETHFTQFMREANRSVFDNGRRCRALCHDAMEVPGKYDLVYIDTPYVSSRGVGVDYLGFYHFLEGLVDYANWPARIDFRKKHRPLRTTRPAWADPHRIRDAFRRLVHRHRDSILVVSYRSDGIPSEEDLIEMIRSVKDRVEVIRHGQYKYALSTNGHSREVLIIGR